MIPQGWCRRCGGWFLLRPNAVKVTKAWSETGETFTVHARCPDCDRLVVALVDEVMADDLALVFRDMASDQLAVRFAEIIRQGWT